MFKNLIFVGEICKIFQIRSKKTIRKGKKDNGTKMSWANYLTPMQSFIHIRISNCIGAVSKDKYSSYKTYM